MRPRNSSNDYLADIDILGQQPWLNLYTPICAVFPVAEASSYPQIINTLQNGLERLSTSFPWVAGQVVNEGAYDGNSGKYIIEALERIPRLTAKDLRDDPSVPSMADLRRAKFPMNMLHESIIAPRKTLPSVEEAKLASPVFLVQATYIIGGLVLSFLGQHNAVDMTGQGQIIHLLSKACRDESFTSEELSVGNLSRRNTIPLLDSDSDSSGGPKLVRQVPKQLSPNDTAHVPASPPKSNSACFSFSSTSLAALKTLATNTLPPSTEYVTTDDALSAFIWQSVARARLPRLGTTAESVFGRAVDVRRYLDLPLRYPGIINNMAYNIYTLRNLIDEPLGHVASQLRSTVDPKTSDVAYRTRALATFLHRSADKTHINFVGELQDLYKLDFGLGLGKPESVRRLSFDPVEGVEGLTYLMPRALDGEIAAAICLRDEDMEKLTVDEGFQNHTRIDMHPRNTSNDYLADIDILGQQPGLNLYTQICAVFPVAEASSYPQIINTLQNGLERLSASFPWVAGQVVNEGACDGNTGNYMIEAFERIPRLTAKDLRDDPSVPSMADLRRAKFPMNMLHESIIAPRKTLPSVEEAKLASPVFLVQATYIIGGLVLSFLGQHNAVDMTGQGQIIHLLSKACRDESFTSEELSVGNLSRRNTIPLLDDSDESGGPKLVRQFPKQLSPNDTAHVPASPPKSNWACFSFSSTSLTALKALATKTLPPSTEYVTTDDALSAFIWQSVARARLPRLGTTAESVFGRAVDVRRYLDLPLRYPGIINNMAYNIYTLRNLIDEPLGHVASQLRSTVDPKTSDVAYRTRALATFLHRSADKTHITVTASMDPSSDIMFSSWAKEDFYNLDFGLGLGKPES
ncbi:hypothetical protein H0H92_006671, partial [Tricholoma furcatifolium]